VVFLTLMLVSGNTMAIAVRERAEELAVMRTIGFPAGLTAALVVAESVALALVGGGLGLGLVKGFTLLGDPTGGLLPIFYLAPTEIGLGLLLALAVGAVAGLVPATAAARTPVAQALRGF